MSSDEESYKGATKGSSYVRFKNRKHFPEWKRKTEALAGQQGYARFLNKDIKIKDEDDLEALYIDYQAETDAKAKKTLKTEYLKEKRNAKLSTTASCMLMLAMPASMSQKLEEVKHDPFKMWNKICEKYDKKNNNKLTSLCKEFTKLKLRKTKTDPDDWFTELNVVNEKIGRINSAFKNSEKQLAMHIMNNMCSAYSGLKVILENDPNYLNDLDMIQTKIQNHWEQYHDKGSDYSNDSDNDSDDYNEKSEEEKDMALNIQERKSGSDWKKVTKGGKEEKFCNHCKRPGHDESNCFKKHGFPSHWEDRRVCFKCNETGHIANNCPKDNNENEDNNEEADINSLFIGSIDI